MSTLDPRDDFDGLPAGAGSIDRQATPAERPTCRVCGDRPSCDCGHEPEDIDDIERRYHRYQRDL